MYQTTRLIVLFAVAAAVQGQQREFNRFGDFRVHGEFRTRVEGRSAVAFGRDADLANPLLRFRFGLDWTPRKWIKLAATAQDSRAPLYGGPAPGSARDTLDLQEAYIDIKPGRFHATAGRRMLSYGEGRVIGVPQWVNTARTYDHAIAGWDFGWIQPEAIIVSVTRVRPDDFNRASFADRLWGSYNKLPRAIKSGTLELYVLRHDAFALGTRTVSYGVRATGPLPGKLRYSVESIAQGGQFAGGERTTGASYTSVSRTLDLGRPVTLSAEYKYATPSFDQLYPANHDKFGHADLFGWRNIHNWRSLDTVRISKWLAVNVMLDASWLADPRQPLYNGQGRPIAQSATGRDGTHIGREVDVYATVSASGFQFGAGFAQFFPGEFLKRTTPGLGTRLVYVFQGYSF